MTALPTPEQFLASPADPEEDEEQPVDAPAPTPTVGEHAAPRDSLESIAASLGLIAAHLTSQQVGVVNEATEPLLQRIEKLEAEFREVEALHDAKQELIEQALVILKPSTSKLANNLRAVLEPVVTAAPEPELTDPPPVDDAPIEDWLAYAGARGLDVDPGRTNRSQIRTMLGIPQPVKPAGGEEA